MGIYLNSIVSYERFKRIVEETYYIDKTSILKELIPMLSKEQSYICITRPRRFGKTVMANLIAAFFEKAIDSKNLFEKLEIGKDVSCMQHLNQHDVIYIDFSEIPRECDSYKKYIHRIEEGLMNDLAEVYPDIVTDKNAAVWDMLAKIFEKRNRQKFIFVLDEWDAVFHMSFVTEKDKVEYLLFLKSLLKSKAYVELAYMTGILPIAKYSDGSELNMFMEYDMAGKIKFNEYFGFSDEEVDRLYERYRNITPKARLTREQLREWYDGYYTASGERMYNPRSVVCALTDNQLANYWTSSGTYDSVFYYIKNNIDDVRDDLALMVSGERVEIRMQEYAATASALNTRDQIFSAMVVYGLLTYEDGEVFIPNKELMIKFEEMLLNKESVGYIHRLAKESGKMLRATIDRDTETMAKILQYVHNTETPILSYNNEIELAAVINLVYLSARDRYRVEREDKAGKGYVDFIFYPVKAKDDCIILELKVDHSPEEAISQIKEKDYVLRFYGKLGEAPKYKGRILLVGIGYNRETKEHRCCVEIYEK